MTAKKKLSSSKEKTDKKSNLPKFVIGITLKLVALLLCLYIFIVSLELMSSGFRLLGSGLIGETNRLNQILDNKIAGLMVGILVTVLVQSSSTSTSIVVSMVSAQIVNVKAAIPVIMGANIGTSITSTLVSFSQMANIECFERAFAGAIVHDIFNLLSVCVQLPLEYTTSYLERITSLLVQPLLKYSTNSTQQNGGAKIEVLNALTKPLANLIIQLDDAAFDELATGSSKNRTEPISMIKRMCTASFNKPKKPCVFLFSSTSLPEWAVGLILALVSLLILCLSLFVLVKLLNSIFFGRMATCLNKYINSDLPGFCKHFTGYIFILIGAGLTLIIQSSSVFTSTLTPLVGIGIVTIERVFPLILGSNIGTTITGILAALSSPSRTLYYALQIALCHTLFNITGILVWYPLPFMRNIPIRLAKKIGAVSGRYKWFAVVYILVVFLVVPLFLLALSYTGTIIFSSVFGTFMTLIAFILVINFLQSKRPKWLPNKLRTWQFLPTFLRSLEPYDKMIRCCRNSRNSSDVMPSELTNANIDTYLNTKINVKNVSILLDSSNLYRLDKIRS